LSALFHPYLCGRYAAEWLITMLYAIVVVIALILDQGVKIWTTANIVVDTGEAKLLPGLLHLANVHNTGAAFSFLEGARWFFVALCLIFVAVVIYALAMDLLTNNVCRWAAVFVLAGAIGNCIDRILLGFVVDMFELDFLIFGRAFPVFNMADIYITLGMIVFCVALLLEKPADKEAKRTARMIAEATGEAVPEAANARPAKRFGKAAAKSAPAHTRKTDLSDLPKHDLSDVPPASNADPFAEWEKRANAPKEAPKTVSGTVVYSQPKAPAQKSEPAVSAPVQPVQKETYTAPRTAPSVPEQPRQTAAKSTAPQTADEFDLDSILAEFKDL